jgi:hypothetical protein
VRPLPRASPPPHLEVRGLDYLARAGCVHRDDARVPEVEHVAGVGELVLVLDGDDVVALVPDVLAELDARPAKEAMKMMMVGTMMMMIIMSWVGDGGRSMV